jgi:hypothetical protein
MAEAADGVVISPDSMRSSPSRPPSGCPTAWPMRPKRSPVSRGTSVNALIVDSLSAEVARVRLDKDFVARARKLLERDRELLDRLAK